MAERVERMVIAKVDNQGDHIILYPEGYENDRLGYHVIANPEVEVKAGDSIEYEPYGVNFGWFVRVTNKRA
ncbi:hypothetical protein HYV22_03665 [Candidatus Gottesmanbacteria bacterium]|nr:hypothetical protein [Candidatus Gottesmanbacteria bacterium]